MYFQQLKYSLIKITKLPIIPREAADELQSTVLDFDTVM